MGPSTLFEALDSFEWNFGCPLNFLSGAQNVLFYLSVADVDDAVCVRGAKRMPYE